MGGKSSKGKSISRSSSGFNGYNYGTPAHPHAQGHYGDFTPQTPGAQPKPDTKYSRIADNYQTLEQVTAALAQAGLESSNLIVGIDFTKSNEWTGVRSFNRRSLHSLEHDQNPYEQAISIIGKTLSAFDEDNLIPCFGFGDATTHDQGVFSFYPGSDACHGFEDVLTRYREIAPQLRLSGPTSFAPIIETAMSIVEKSGGQYHVLLIIADGQVTQNVNPRSGQLSTQEQKTINAIVKASEYPLSIVVVGVGDGPWDMMKVFDDNIPARAFDNFQFVNFTDIMSKNVELSRKQAEFALSALMEIPSQYKATIELNLLGHRTGDAPNIIPLPPPLLPDRMNSSATDSRLHSSTGFYQNHAYGTGLQSAPPFSLYNSKACPVCLSTPKDMAFECGHQTCQECGSNLQFCPICRNRIKTRIKLYS